MTHIILGPIIGGLSHERVNLWARTDKAATLYAWLGTKTDNAKLVGKTQLTAKTGFAGIVAVKGLEPAKKYFFALTLDRKLIPAKKDFHTFKTFPPPGKAKSFRFAFGSCFLPIRPQPGLAFKHMLEEQKDLAFLLMLGDQIYSDEGTTNGLGHPALTLDEYRRVYQTSWSNPYHRALLAETPTFMILDDHEVDNDWHWKDAALTHPDLAWLSRLLRKIQKRPMEEQYLTLDRARAALQANWEHQVIHAPAQLPPTGPLAYEFEYGSAAFFIMDTRTQRVLNNTNRQLLGEKQWQMLKKWFLRVRDTHPVKFLVSSISIMTDLIGDPTDDRWEGFRAERERLFRFIADNRIEGVHILTGDLHAAHCISANLKDPNGDKFPIWQYCASAFEQTPAKFAYFLDQPAPSRSLHDKKRHFSISEINYGVIEVTFTRRADPQVKFELNYERKGTWQVK